MSILLDTHMVIWWLDDAPELPASVVGAIAAPDAAVLVSAISLAEISVKRAVGKLRAPLIPDALLEQNGLEVLDFTASHARRMLELPLHHRDPFDRMLIAQALEGNHLFATIDRRASAYGVRVLGAA